MFDPTSQLKKPSFLDHVFKAKVVNNNDPLKNQRVTIRINGLHDTVQDVDLPWAIKRGNSSITGNTGHTGEVSVPDIGSDLHVIMQDESDNYPIYVGYGFFGNSIPIELLNLDYPNTVGFIDKNNNLFFINKHTNEVKYNHKSGTILNILPSGEIHIISSSGGNINISSNGTTQILSSGITNISAMDRLQILSSSRIDISAPAITFWSPNVSTISTLILPIGPLSPTVRS